MRGSRRHFLAGFLVFSLFKLNLGFCSTLNDEAVALLRFKKEIVSDPYEALANWIDEVGVKNPCSWFGVGCFKEHVVALDLKDLHLRGTMAPEIGNLVHLKSINLCNNSFSGVIAEEMANLKELEVLDLRYNNFNGPLPCHLSSKLSSVGLLLDDNEFLERSPPECKPPEDDRLSGHEQASPYYDLLILRKSMKTRVMTGRKLLKQSNHYHRHHLHRIPSPSPSPSPSSPRSPSASSPSNSNSPIWHTTPVESPIALAKSSSTNHKLIISAATGTPLVFLFLVVGIYSCRRGKISTIKPWRTGLSGQLQRAFITGVPKLKRSEILAACEDFSNVIGSLSVCTLYKGTLSSGVEIAVASFAIDSKKEWWSSLKAQFRKKIDALSKVKHKNFVSLLGYCEEEEPFTRMMVFEYAPNGTLFEHLHIKEAELLSWEVRLRVAMGIAYCLDNMHQSTPPFAHRNLTSSSVYLSDDYAAKISDFLLWDEGAATERQATPETNVYSFGVLLFEMMTGHLPYSSGSDSHENWASECLGSLHTLEANVDPTLATYGEEQLEQIKGLIKLCTNPEPRLRPPMKKVCERLREVTGIGPNKAIPMLSPLWWAEVEIMANEVAEMSGT